MKPKILLCNEASFLNSGYSNYGKQIMTRLFATNKYDLAELACYGTVNDPRVSSIPWKYYPNSVESTDKRYEKYKSSPLNQFGHWRFDIVCLDFKPDIVFDVRDPWMFDYQSSSPLRKFFNWIVMPAMDSIPQKIDWLTTFKTADILVPYTEWAKTYLSSFKNLWHQTTPAGIDTSIYKPSKNRKTEFGIPENSFVVGSVMRNQRRKLIPALFEVISKIRESNKNVVLYLHTTFPEMSGWNIPSLLIEYNIANSVYFTYKCKHCKNFYPSKFSGPQSFCKKCNEFAATMSSTMDGITDDEMCDIYNMFDMYIQYAICEGFGMPQVEAAACGIPVASVDYSAMSEVVRNINGFPIPLASLSYELESHAKRAYPDTDRTIEIINSYIKSSIEYKQSLKQKTLNGCIHNYSWDNIASTWMSVFDAAITQNNKKSWYASDQFILSNQIKLDISLNNFDLVKYICYEVIKEPGLIETNFIQNMLIEMDYGIQKFSGQIGPYNRNMAIDKLEKYANTKAFLDQIRVSKEKIMEDYITSNE